MNTCNTILQVLFLGESALLLFLFLVYCFIIKSTMYAADIITALIKGHLKKENGALSKGACSSNTCIFVAGGPIRRV